MNVIYTPYTKSALSPKYCIMVILDIKVYFGSDDFIDN